MSAGACAAQPPASHPPAAAEAWQAQLAALHEWGIARLRTEWVRVCHSQPPPRSKRDLLIRAIAYRLQARVYGGLSKATQRRLKTLARELDAGDGTLRTPAPSPKPGARLVREWHGTIHTVTALEAGFEYRGQRFASLTQVARAITGTHWSGPRFFGLAGRRRAAGNARG